MSLPLFKQQTSCSSLTSHKKHHQQNDGILATSTPSKSAREGPNNSTERVNRANLWISAYNSHTIIVARLVGVMLRGYNIMFCASRTAHMCTYAQPPSSRNCPAPRLWEHEIITWILWLEKMLPWSTPTRQFVAFRDASAILLGHILQSVQKVVSTCQVIFTNSEQQQW